MNAIEEYENIISDKALFDEIIYTPLSEAIVLLAARQQDASLLRKVESLLKNDIPEPFKKLDLYAVSTKQIATPNIEVQRFIKLANEFGLKPIFSEYLDDKFASNNEFKHSLGQLTIKNTDRGSKSKNLEKINIIEFNKSNGKPLKKISTLWGESLVDFHRNLFHAYNINTDNLIFYDASNWLQRNGGEARNYYKNDLLLLVCHGILFENFLVKGQEGNFSRDVLLPAFMEVVKLVGVKPLIVPICPLDIEDDVHWYSYDEKIKSLINKNLK